MMSTLNTRVQPNWQNSIFVTLKCPFLNINLDANLNNIGFNIICIYIKFMPLSWNILNISTIFQNAYAYAFIFMGADEKRHQF